MPSPRDPIKWKFCLATNNADSTLRTQHTPHPPLPPQHPLLLLCWMAKQFSYVQTQLQIPQSDQSQLPHQVGSEPDSRGVILNNLMNIGNQTFYCDQILVFRAGLCHCVVTLEKKPHSTLSFSTKIHKWIPANCWRCPAKCCGIGNPVTSWYRFLGN